MPADLQPLVLTLAGEPAVRRGDAWIALGAREAALLAWLAIEGPTPRARLASLLWPGSSPEAARSALRQRLFKLQRLSGSAPVVGTQLLALAAHIEHDLAGADGVLGERQYPVGAEFDAWLAHQRALGRDRMGRALVQRRERAEAAGDFGRAIVEARALLALEPLSEEAHRQLIRLLYLAGDRPAALLAFDACERVLKDEVGVAPDAETVTLLQTIIRADAAALGERVAATREMPAAVSRPPRRIGRAAVWAMLARTDRQRRIRVVFAEAGMGKSRLLEDLVQGAAPRLVLVRARAGDASVPYVLATRLLRTAAVDRGVAPTAVQRATLGCILPEWSDSPPGRAGADRSALAPAATAVLEAAVTGGLAGIAVDDLQFADQASVELLQALVAVPGCAWTLAVRPQELRPAARAWIEALEDDVDVDMATLEPLSAGEVAELLESLSLPALKAAQGADRVASLHHHTGGNPLYVLETVKALLAAPRPMGDDDSATPVAWPAASNVMRLIRRRLGRLSVLARGIARCAAIAGQDTSPHLVAHVLERSPLDLADAWAELEAAHVLAGDGRFAHDLIADAAFASVPRALVAPLHADVARWLEAHAGEPARIAEHWLAADETMRAVPALLAAGERAWETRRPQEAATLFEQAATILAAAGDRRGAFDARFRATSAQAQLGLGERVEALQDGLLDLADDEGQLAMAAMFLVSALVEQRRLPEALEAARGAVQQAARAGLAEIEAEHCYAMTMLHWERRDLEEAKRCAQRTCVLLAGVPLERRFLKWCSTEPQAAYALAFLLCASGSYAEGEARLEDLGRKAAQSGDLQLARDVHRALAGFAMERGDLARAVACSSAAMRLLDQAVQDTTGSAMLLTRHADILMLDGQLGAAIDCHRRSAALCEIGVTRHHAGPVRLALLQHALGRHDLARAGLAAASARAGSMPDLGWLYLQAAWLAIGEAGDARTVLESTGGIADLWSRVVVLCLAAPGCEPLALLHALEPALATTRDRGAEGLALSLETRRVAAWRSVGRDREAADAAVRVWQQLEQRVCGLDMLPDAVALLGPSLAAADPSLARAATAKAHAWMRAAASTLPPEWRENYLARAPVRRTLQAAGTG